MFIGECRAQSPEELYVKANASYENEDYEKAASLYENLIKFDKVSAEVFYNLGNSYFKSKKIGKAIVNYRRALRLAPADSDARGNLSLARSMTVDKIERPDKGILVRIILAPYTAMNINYLTVLVSLLYLAIVTFLAVSIFFASKRKVLFYVVWIFAVALIISLIFLTIKIHDENFIKHAVVISEKVDVRSGPKEDYLLQFTLHEGAEVRLVKESQGWYEIGLSRDLRGWLPKDSVEVI
jgi:tetratricopeptide (TPR) repeat protein